MSLHDRGSVSVLGVAVMGVTVLLGVAAVQAGAVVVTQAGVNAAADLAALAAAHVDRNERASGASSSAALGAACQEAAKVAQAQGTALTSCVRSSGESVTVLVRDFAGPFEIQASARAGSVALTF